MAGGSPADWGANVMNRVAKQGDTNHGVIDARSQNEKTVVRLVIGETSR
jgi:hypothetical protein